MEWKTLEPKLRASLKGFVDAPPHETIRFSIGPSLKLEIFRASTLHPTFFVMAGCIDRESGGWLVSEIARNLQICIDEKTRKIKRFRSKYPIWWLVLVDRIARGLDDSDLEQFKAVMSPKHQWDKVIVVDPNNFGRSFEV